MSTSTVTPAPPADPTLANVLKWMKQVEGSVLPGIIEAQQDWTTGQKAEAVTDIVKTAAQAFSTADPQYAATVNLALDIYAIGAEFSVVFYTLFHHPKPAKS